MRRPHCQLPRASGAVQPGTRRIFRSDAREAPRCNQGRPSLSPAQIGKAGHAASGLVSHRHRSEEGPYQCEVGRAGRQQANCQRQLHAFAEGMECRSHGRTIRRFWRRSLADSFFRNLPLIKDSRHNRKGPFWPYCRAADRGGGGNLKRLHALTAGQVGAETCRMRCFPMMPN